MKIAPKKARQLADKLSDLHSGQRAAERHRVSRNPEVSTGYSEQHFSYLFVFIFILSTFGAEFVWVPDPRTAGASLARNDGPRDCQRSDAPENVQCNAAGR